MSAMKVLNYFPTNTAAANALGVSREAVRKWERDGVPAERVLQIAEATKWKVTPHMLRSDIYPNPTDALPKQAV